MSDTRISLPLEVRGLDVEYRTHRGGVTALDGVSFDLRPGEFAAVVGESGSGKSTLIGAVTGLLPTTARIRAGGVLLGGTETTQLRERAWSKLRGRRFALVPQDPGSSLNPVLTIGAQIDEVFALRGERFDRAERRRRAIELLQEAEVSRASDRLAQYPHELSGGLKQRILIAMAFGLNPAMLVADEPTSALDVTVQRQILRVFDRLVHEHHTSVLFVTHDIALATDHASRIMVMRDGRLVEDAAVEKIVRSPATPYTEALIAHARAGEEAAPATPENASPPVLRVQGLGKVFPGRRGTDPIVAAEDVSFDVPAGRTVALVGESGSGKSTTARLIMRLLDPTSGRIVVRERDVTGITGKDRIAHWRDVQFVYQNPDSALDPRWTVRRIVGEPLHTLGRQSRAERDARVEELLDAVSLPPGTADKRPAELSGGQRQRVAIARALAPRSSLVVLDEALSALDVITQEQVLDLLVRLQREFGVSYLFISHDLSVVRRLAHRVVVMRAGRVVEAGGTTSLFTDPQTDYVRELLAAVPGRRLLTADAPSSKGPA